MDTPAILALIAGILGIAGGFLPVVPGPPLSWLALLLVYFSDSAIGAVSVRMLVVWGIAAAVITVLDYVLPGIFSRLTGGSKAAQRGATIGLVIGLFATPVGMVAGSFLGAFFAELISENKPFGAALKAAFGTFIAFIFTVGMKVIYSVVLLWKIFGFLF